MDIPGYKIIDRLGQGGMATVYLAIQESFEREVALKVLSPELLRDPAFGERFLREAKIVSRLVHPNIVTVYDVGVQNGHHYLSMEYVPGKDLKQLRTKLSRAQGLQVVKDIARALDYAARKGYVHRDVKPENIMLHEEDGRAVLMDFGIARPAGVESGMTQTGTAIGTPHYMSPEQAKGKSVDARSDIYSLGVVLFQLITGRVPFDADSAVAVGIKHVAEPIPRLPAAFAVFQSIVDQVLAKDPDQRYQTGAELVADLEQIDDDDLRRVDELIDLAAQRLEQADTNAPTVISSALDTRAVQAADSDEAAVAQHWPQSGQGTPVQSIGRRGSDNPFGGGGGALRWLRNGLLLLLLCAGIAFGFRQQLPAPWPATITQLHHATLDWLKARALPLSDAQWQWLYQLGGAQLPAKEPTQVEAVPQVTPTAAPSPVPVAPTPTPARQRADAVLADTRPVLSDDGVLAKPKASAPEVASVEVGQARERQLQADMRADLAASAALADYYRELAQQPAQAEQARQGQQWVANFFEEALTKAQSQGDLARVQALLDTVRQHFPALQDEPAAHAAAEFLAREQEIQGLMATASAQFARDALLSPAGDNAVDSYRQVLALAPAHTAARQGLAAVAERYQQLAQEKLAAGDWRNASALAERGLSVDAEHAGLRRLRADARRAEQAASARAQTLKQLTASADQALAAGNIYGAEGAVAQYLAMLEVAPEHAPARRGIATQLAATQAQVREFIAQKRFERAQQSFNQAQQLLAQEPTLRALKSELDAAVAAAMPRIDQVRIGAQTPVAFADRQPLVKGADRTLYIGMKFHNFDETAVVQAILLDGARAIQIAQVPVVVSGRVGEKVFRIDRPVEGFAAGGYNLDLMLGDQLLVSQHFQIANP